MTDYTLISLKETLNKFDKDTKIKLIYEWTCTKVINLKQFKELLKEVEK